MGAQNASSILIATIIAGVGVLFVRKWYRRSVEDDVDVSPFLHAIVADTPCSCIIKLGGSACTVKDSFETYNFNQVSKLGDQLLRLKSSHSGFRPILLHGAGSFGHFQAKQYSVSAGALSGSGSPHHPSEIISNFLREGFARTRLSVTTLNQHILTTLVEQGLASVTVSPFPLLRTLDRQLVPSEWSPIFHRNLAELLALGFLPVLHGDACMDDGERITTILSGDSIFVYLCGVYRPKYAVFLTDVDGVLTGPPGTIPPPETIPLILVDDDCNWANEQEVITTQAYHDVTGGMGQKLKAAIEVASKFHIPVFIAKAGTTSAEMAMRGETPTIGTSVLYFDRE